MVRHAARYREPRHRFHRTSRQLAASREPDMSRGDYRPASGGRLHRNPPIAFDCEDRRLHGYRAATLASPLPPSGIRLAPPPSHHPPPPPLPPPRPAPP